MPALDRAKMYYQMGRIAEAEAACRSVLAHNPSQFDGLHLLGVILYQQGRPKEAHDLLSQALKLKPRSPQVLPVLMAVLIALGRLEEALAVCDRTIAAAPRDVDALYNRGVLLSRLRRFDAAVLAFDKVLAVDAGNIDALFLRGNALAESSRFAEAADAYDRVLKKASSHVGALANRGNALAAVGKYADALLCYDNALAIKPNDVDTIVNRGVSLKQLGRDSEAIASYTRALALAPKHWNSLFNRGNALLAVGRAAEALADYELALAVSPRQAEAWVGRGNALRRLNRVSEALESYGHALALAPDQKDALINSGNAFVQLGRFDEAIAAYERGLAKFPNDVALLASRGAALASARRFDAAIADFKNALEIAPKDPMALGGLVNASLEVCDWAGLDRSLPELRVVVEQGGSVPPLLLIRALDDPSLHLKCARSYVQANVPPPSPPLIVGGDRPDDKIRIAYLSADFRHHPVAYLLAGLVERHDRARFDVTAISFGPDDDSEIRSRLARAFDRFEDVRLKSDREVVKLLGDLRVDIAIDLMGHTLGSRLGVLACRPVPICVNYLGYPGPMGADFIDYIIADSVTLPFDQRPRYAEKIVHLPECFFLHDPQKQISSEVPSRAQAGLPERGFVFCCFNNSYKLTAPVFGVWMRLLSEIEGSVLWLSQANERAAVNLRAATAAAGVDPERVIFAPRVPSSAEHLARHQLADLFLDTRPYNAHSTANDALWAGVPVLTCTGAGFAGRVAASMLHALGLPELVAESLEEYEALARKLAAEAGLLSDIRRKLDGVRQTTPLFDLDRYRRHIETAYGMMCERHRRGLEPQDFSVPPLGRESD